MDLSSPPECGIQDLLFSITGALPESLKAADKSATCSLFASGGNLSSHSELKRKVSATDGKGNEKRCKSSDKSSASTVGSICFVNNQSLDEDNKSAGITDVLSEVDVGITEFISSHDGFSGILKQRYSDFIVNEINLNGEIVHLTNTDVPPIVTAENQFATNEVLADLLTEDQISRLKMIQESKLTTEEVIIDADCKETRGKIHHLLKSAYPNLDCNTVEKDDIKCIVVRYLARREPDCRRKPPCFSTGDYCRFVLYKENIDTQYAISVIAKSLRKRPGLFTYAGTKDRRGKSCQEVTVYRVPPVDLQKGNKFLRNIVLGNFRICKKPLKLGELTGNHFIIVLRNVTGSDEQIKAGMTSLQDVGFINYYGMQRFGTTRISTHSIGRALLRGAWAEAIDLIMKPREGDKPEMTEAREIWQQTRDPVKTLQAMKGMHCNEQCLLEGLKRSADGDLVTALSYIPRNMRLLYVHAYQSYIWNRVVSQRIREFGLQPRPGDLVFKGKLDEATDFDSEESSEMSEKQGPSSATHVELIVLTEANAADYSITDVVLPLPGYDVQYPENECGKWYNEYLSADGMENFDFRKKIKDYSMSGSYRRIVVKPIELSWEIMQYDDYKVPLVQGDLEIFRRESLPPLITDGGKYKALKLEMSLPSSSYATMAIREVLKCGTSSAYQTTLNVT